MPAKQSYNHRNLISDSFAQGTKKMAGVIQVLSPKGDEELLLPEDRGEAKGKVTELIKKGYKLFVTIPAAVEGSEPKTFKILSYDEKTGEYVTESQDTQRFLAADVKATAIAPVAGG